MPTLSGINGTKAAPSGTSSPSGGLAISAPGHGGNDAQLVAVVDRRGQVIKIADVLVVQIDVDEAANLPILENPLRDALELLSQVIQGCLNGSAAHFHHRLPLGVLPHRGRNMNSNGHCYSFQTVAAEIVQLKSLSLSHVDELIESNGNCRQ